MGDGGNATIFTRAGDDYNASALIFRTATIGHEHADQLDAEAKSYF